MVEGWVSGLGLSLTQTLSLTPTLTLTPPLSLAPHCSVGAHYVTHPLTRAGFDRLAATQSDR